MFWIIWALIFIGANYYLAERSDFAWVSILFDVLTVLFIGYQFIRVFPKLKHWWNTPIVKPDKTINVKPVAEITHDNAESVAADAKTYQAPNTINIK